MVTAVILVITIAVSLYGFSNESFQRKLLFNPYLANRPGEYYRFISSGFIHGGILHLAFNALVLFSFGAPVERVYSAVHGPVKGTVLYALLYLGALIFSEVGTFAKYRNNPAYNSLGASGAVSAVIFASIVFAPLNKIYLWGIIGIPGILMGPLFLIISQILSRRGKDNINHDAHFYGAIFGFIYTILLKPKLALAFIQQIVDVF